MPWGLSGYALQKTRSMVSELYAAQEQQRRLAQQGTQKQLQEQGEEMTPKECEAFLKYALKKHGVPNASINADFYPDPPYAMWMAEVSTGNVKGRVRVTQKMLLCARKKHVEAVIDLQAKFIGRKHKCSMS